MKIIDATPEHMDRVRELFREFQDEIETDCCFQGFEEELKSLPGDYANPIGALLITMEESQAVACVAVKPTNNAKSNAVAELKRLYVKKAYRGTGLGKTLFKTSIAKIQEMGYKTVFLETVPVTMPKAYQLYINFGFQLESNPAQNIKSDDTVHRLYYHLDKYTCSNQS